MAWITPTADDVLSEFTPTELAAITTLLGQSPFDNTAPISIILSRTIDEIRSYIDAGNYTLDADPTTIPAGFVNDAIAICRWRFLVSAPQLKQLQTDERKALYLASIAKLNMVANQKFTVEPPIVTPVANSNWNSENKILMRTHPTPAPSTQFQVQPNQPAYANPNAPPDAP